MGRRQIVISKNKIKKYLKKYRWILSFLVIIGIFGFCWGVYSNQQEKSSMETISQYQKEILFISELSNNTFIEDFRVILSANDFMKSISDNEKIISAETERVEGSNCLLIIVSSNDKEAAKEIADEIVAKGQEKFKEYYPEISVKEVEEKYLVEDINEVPLVRLKDLLVLVGPFLVGAFAIYILMVCDDKFYDRKSLEYYVGIPVCEYTETECRTVLAEVKDCEIVIGENVRDVLKEKQSFIKLCDFIRKKEGVGKEKVLIVKQECITAREIEEFMEVLEKDTVSKCRIFMLAI